MNCQCIISQIEELIAGVNSLMDVIVEYWKGKSCSPNSKSFDLVYSRLKNLSSDVMLCGEVKRGKSFLLNAIIGSDVLPVNVDTATSQVFRISSSNDFSCNLVFTDGQMESVTRDQLLCCGSIINGITSDRINIDGRVISYIQVNTPGSFLLDKINFVDTPGFGSIYKSNDWLIQNYIKHASVVLFVFDATCPMVDIERTYINQILDITRSIIFIITKIDLINTEDCITVKNRIEEELTKIYNQRGLSAPVVYPVSSRSLMEFSTEKDDDKFKMEHLRSSHFSPIQEAIEYMVSIDLPLKCCDAALFELSDILSKTKEQLSDQLIINDDSINETVSIINKLSERKLEAESSWSPKGSSYISFSNSISSVCNGIKKSAEKLYSKKGTLFKHYNSLINSAKSVEELKKISDIIPHELVEDLVQRLNSILNDAMNKTNVVISSIATAGEKDNILHEFKNCGISAEDLTESQKLLRLRNVIETRLSVCPSRPIGYTPIPVMCLQSPWIFYDKKQIQLIKKSMKENLNKLMDKFKGCITGSDGQQSVLDEFISTLKRYAYSEIHKFTTDLYDSLQQQIAILKEQSQKDEVVKLKNAEYIKKEIADLDVLIAKTGDCFILLKSIN